MLCRPLVVIALGALFCAAAQADTGSNDGYQIGETTREFAPAAPREWRGAQKQTLSTRIWYPVDRSAGVVANDIGPPGHAVFIGHPTAGNAPLSNARPAYPVLVISHGTGGTAEELDWIASSLAAHGYIVAGVNHPGNNAFGPLTREGFVLWWERATDLSEVLDGMLADPTFGAHIDRHKIGAVGFSLGGYTVLELAGARTDLQGFEAYCHSPAADSNCHPPAEKTGAGAGASAPAPLPAAAVASLKRSGASYRDPRIKAVLAMAPALGKALDPQSLTHVDIPIRLIAGTADTTAPPPGNILHVAQFLPRAQVSMIDGATHNTFLDSCLPAAMKTLANICQEAPGVDRNAIHMQVSQQAVDFFQSIFFADGAALRPPAAEPAMPGQ